MEKEQKEMLIFRGMKGKIIWKIKEKSAEDRHFTKAGK